MALARNSEAGHHFDEIVDAFIARSRWCGRSDFSNDGGWLAKPEWMVADDREGDAHLYFTLGTYTPGTVGNPWTMSRMLGAGEEQIGYWLTSDSAGKAAFKKAWREFGGKASLPLEGADFFLPLRLDREALALAAADGDMTTALDLIGGALDRLQSFAAQLDPLKEALAGAAARAG